MSKDETTVEISTPGGDTVVTSIDGMRRAADAAERGVKAMTLFGEENEPTRFALKIKAGEASLLAESDRKRGMRGRGTTVFVVQELRIDAVTQKDVFDADGYRKHTVQEHTATVLNTRTMSQQDAMAHLFPEVEAESA